MEMENGDRIKIHEEIAVLKTQVDYISIQVTNHIPTAIKEVKKDAILAKEVAIESAKKVNLKLNWLFVLFVSGLIGLILDLVKNSIK